MKQFNVLCIECNIVRRAVLIRHQSRSSWRKRLPSMSRARLRSSILSSDRAMSRRHIATYPASCAASRSSRAVSCLRSFHDFEQSLSVDGSCRTATTARPSSSSGVCSSSWFLPAWLGLRSARGVPAARWSRQHRWGWHVAWQRCWGRLAALRRR